MSSLEKLLNAVDAAKYCSKAMVDAYNAYMEERKRMPQAGQEIEVWDGDNPKHGNSNCPEFFIGFKNNGNVIVEDSDGTVTEWEHYRIPTPKKKWKVVRATKGDPFVVIESDPIDLPIITIFED